jgi:hypothetical protein
VIEKIQGPGGFVNYSVRAKPKETSIAEVLGRELIIDEIPDLREFVAKRLKGYDALKTVLYGRDEELSVEELVERYTSLNSSEDSEKVSKENVEVAEKQVVTSKPRTSAGQLDIEEMLGIARQIAEQFKSNS